MFNVRNTQEQIEQSASMPSFPARQQVEMPEQSTANESQVHLIDMNQLTMFEGVESALLLDSGNSKK